MTCTLMTLIGPTCGLPISSDDCADPTSLDRMKGKTKSISFQAEDIRTTEGWVSKGERDSGGNNIPFTSDSFLATFGVVDFFPMTVLWSQSTVASMSIVVVYAGGGCGPGYTLSMSCPFLIRHLVTLTRKAAAERL